MGWTSSADGKTRNVYSIFAVKYREKQPLPTSRGREVDGTGSGLCPVAGFGISGVEPWDSATTVLVSYLGSLLR